MTECDVEAVGRSSWHLALSPVCDVTHAASGDAMEPRDHPCSELTRILDDIRRVALRDPEQARISALRLVSLLGSPAGRKRANCRNSLAPWQRRKIARYIEENLDRPLPRDELAAQVSLSTCHFSRAFKETFGEPPHAYVLRAKLTASQTQMLSTDNSLSQIALACGFADQSHFTKAFRRATGETPNAWRRLNLTEPQMESRVPLAA